MMNFLYYYLNSQHFECLGNGTFTGFSADSFLGNWAGGYSPPIYYILAVNDHWENCVKHDLVKVERDLQ